MDDAKRFEGMRVREIVNEVVKERLGSEDALFYVFADTIRKICRDEIARVAVRDPEWFREYIAEMRGDDWNGENVEQVGKVEQAEQVEQSEKESENELEKKLEKKSESEFSDWELSDDVDIDWCDDGKNERFRRARFRRRLERMSGSRRMFIFQELLPLVVGRGCLDGIGVEDRNLLLKEFLCQFSQGQE